MCLSGVSLLDLNRKWGKNNSLYLIPICNHLVGVTETPLQLQREHHQILKYFFQQFRDRLSGPQV